LIRIDDIRPYYDTIDVQVEGRVSPQVSSAGNAFTIGNERYKIELLSKNVAAGMAVVQLTISTIEVIPPPVDVPTHMVQLKLASNSNISQIQKNILNISDKLAEYIPHDPNVKYIRTEMDSSREYMNVYLIWTGPVGMSMSTLGYTKEYSLGIYSMGITDDIKNFIKVYLIPGIILAIGVVLAIAVLTSVTVITAATVILAAVIAASSLVSAWIVHDLAVKQVVSQAIIDNQDAFIQAIAARDAMKKAADDVYAKSTKTNDNCVTLASGYKAADQTYVATLKKVLPKIQLDAAMANYKGISDKLIEDLKAGRISCDTAIANLSPAANALYVNSNDEFSTNYSPTATHEETTCPTDCFICDPLAPGTCIVSMSTAIVVGLGFAGLLYFVTKPKENVIVMKEERSRIGDGSRIGAGG
jgi:hypothetical protein